MFVLALWLLQATDMLFVPMESPLMFAVWAVELVVLKLLVMLVWAESLKLHLQLVAPLVLSVMINEL